ncbi:MAG: methyltransferase domain-containing protein [Alphaproteobacteria bacterium]
MRPALDLLSRIDMVAPSEVVDLGCGAGNVTAHLAARWPGARVHGIDSSPEMLAKAKKDGPPGVIWTRTDIADWTPASPPEIIFANASLHWLDDHPRLFPRLLGMLAPGGVLAVQMPRNFAAPSHLAIEATVRDGPWRARLAPLARATPVGPPERYFDLLAPQAIRLDIWETTYLHVLTGTDPVAAFTESTALGRFLDALRGVERDAFRADYAGRVRAAYPPRADGTTLFPFRRLFLVAEREN